MARDSIPRFLLQQKKIHATIISMSSESIFESESDIGQSNNAPKPLIAPRETLEMNHGERFGEEMLRQMEIANIRLDIDGKSRFGVSWDTAMEWGKAGFEWVKRPSETYGEAVGKAALFSAGTTVFLAPVFLYRNCKQVYDARHGKQREEGGFAVAHA